MYKVISTMPYDNGVIKRVVSVLHTNTDRGIDVPTHIEKYVQNNDIIVSAFPVELTRISKKYTLAILRMFAEWVADILDPYAEVIYTVIDEKEKKVYTVYVTLCNVRILGADEELVYSKGGNDE